MTLQDLVTADDDWDSYESSDPDWFLQAAGAAIRKYCGWHIFPSIQDTVTNVRTGARGIILLPTRLVTEVDQLTIQTGTTPQVIAPDDYTVYPAGWIQRKGWAYWNDWYYSGYYYGNDPYYLPVTQPGIATCTMWHGYATLPVDVKQVAFELALNTLKMPVGNVKEISSPGYRLALLQAAGMTLNCDQKARLANYRIGMTI